MILRGLGPEDLAALERALRAGERCELHLDEGFPRGRRADQLIPLLDAVRARTEAETRGLATWLPPQGRPGHSGPRVTAVIPTNRRTPWGLDTLRDQDVELEVLVLSNGGVRGIQGDRVVEVRWSGHGATRQRGVELADGDYLLFTVDDAIPRGRGTVRALVEALEEGGYDAVFGRQLPWPSSDPVTCARLEDWTPPAHGHRWVDRLDHVWALYRRETLLEHPLPDVPIGEDLHWRQGRRIGYVPESVVVHAHDRRPGDLYRRTRDLHVQHHLVGEEPRVPSLAALLRALPGVVRPVLQAGGQELPNQLAELLGQWRAARATR